MRSILMACFVLFVFNAEAGLLMIKPVVEFDTGGSDTAEISAFDPGAQQLFVTNSDDNVVDVYDFSNPANGVNVAFSIDIEGLLGEGGPNSVAVSNGIVAVAVEADIITNPGLIAFFDTDGDLIGQVTVGALPDNVIFSDDGQTVLSANEGEADGGIDPEGSISIIDISTGVATATVSMVGFTDFNADGPRASELPAGVRVIGTDGSGPVSVAADLEPEFIALSADSSTAYVSLQENNALAIIDVVNAEVISIVDAGRKNHNLPGNGFDASNEDGGINIQNWPVTGLYQPDSIATVTINGSTFVLTANEGDSRGFEEERIADLVLDPVIFPNAADLQLDENLGRLEVTIVDGNTDGDAEIEALVSFGGRSFGIYDAAGHLVFESGDDFEQITAALFGLPLFNSNDNRSDDAGPEPEGIAVAQFGDEIYAFIGLERTGGIMVYDISTPANATFVQYIPSNPIDAEPEGLSIIPASESPTGEALLIVTNEGAGSVQVFSINNIPTPAVPAVQGLMLLVLLMLLVSIGAVHLNHR